MKEEPASFDAGFFVLAYSRVNPLLQGNRRSIQWLWVSVPASSRVNPLLHGNATRCRSGFTREEARTGNAKTSGKKKGADQAPHKP